MAEWHKAFDEATGELQTTVVGAASASSGTKTDDLIDIEGILDRVYDDETQTIRVVTV